MRKRRILCWLPLLAALVSFILPLSHAAEPEVLSVPFQPNPLYADTVDPADYVREQAPGVHPAPRAYIIGMSEEEAAVYLRQEMANRCPVGKDGQISEVITVNVNSAGDPEALMYDLMDRAMAHTGVPGEGDNLLWEYAGWGCEAYYTPGTHNYTLHYTVGYYTTDRQEKLVADAVQALLSRTGLEGMSDYEKVHTIYSFICSAVKYDYDNLYDNSYVLKFTAYAALMDGTAVCQGYANLFYRMALEAGVDCRIIPGVSGGMGHAWNIVRLDGKYYNLDSTWDAGCSDYLFFLRCESNFTDHTRDPDYATDKFHRQYPMDTQDYDPCHAGHIWNGGRITTSATCAKTGVKTYVCTACGEIKTESVPATGKHSYAATGTVAPDCDERGCTEYTCSTCGGTKQDDFTAALGHVWENGICSRCGVAFGEHFLDVPDDAYYVGPAKWAAANGITSGTDGLHFTPARACTRAEVVTFLWRANGSPAPTETDCTFTDVAKGSWYYDAMLWAVEEGITRGTSAATFAPTRECSRAEVVTFLHRAEGSSPPVQTDHPFTDVENGWYYDAMLWAVENHITNGTGSGSTFSPAAVCDRAQVVTFLYRAK